MVKYVYNTGVQNFFPTCARQSSLISEIFLFFINFYLKSKFFSLLFLSRRSKKDNRLKLKIIKKLEKYQNKIFITIE